MSHITIIISRKAHAPSPNETAEQIEEASVTYAPPHDATDADVGKAVKKLFKTIREMGP